MTRKRLEDLLSSNPSIIYSCKTDEPYGITFISENVTAIFGYEPQELIEDESFWISHIHPDDKIRICAELPQLFEVGHYSCEYRFLDKDGAYRWVLDAVNLVRDEEGNPIECVGSRLDITQRKQAEATCQESQRLLQAITEENPNLLYVYDLIEQRNIYSHRELFAILGYTLEEIEQMGKAVLSNLMHPDDLAVLPQHFKRLENAKDGEIFEFEYRMRHKNGEWRWMFSRDSVFTRNTEGKPRQIVGAAADISDRKLASEALRQQKELLQTIFDHIPVMVAFYDANGQIQLLNREAERVLGWSLAEIGEVDVFAECYPDPKYRQTVLDFMQAATGKWQDFKIRTREGQLLDTSWADIRLSDGTSIGIGQDITERKQAEEALRALTQREREKATQLKLALTELQRTQAQLVLTEKIASLGQLVAGVAHEINNPVSFIYANINPAMGYTQDLLNLIELYQRHYPDPVAEITEQLEAIDPNFIAEDFPKLLMSMKEGAERISQIVLSLRNFSRLDEAERKWVDIHEGIDNALLLMQHRLKQQPNRSRIQVIKEYGQLPLIECYPGQLNQVFMSLLCNAINAIDEATSIGQEVRQEEESNLSPGTTSRTINTSCFAPMIRICTEVNDSNSVLIRITDNGLGMTKEVQQKIFNLFFTTKSVGQGTGLGLSISYQ
ncbi:MAG TPA: hypothetical protein DCP31_40765, partial [Cyanobacteria bacterium UBA8543]|nr:hypothetical protein [Cyanobacteria bacterium UBA8543]